MIRCDRSLDTYLGTFLSSGDLLGHVTFGWIAFVSPAEVFLSLFSLDFPSAGMSSLIIICMYYFRLIYLWIFPLQSFEPVQPLYVEVALTAE